MQWLVVCVLTASVYGGGVTKNEDVAQFWTDDYKTFEQVYGKTSDKEIYGEKLPPNVSDTGKIKAEASEKKERYAEKASSDEVEDQYAKFLAKQALKYYGKEKSTKSPIKFLSYTDFKPISQSSDPETYNYFKELEQEQRKKKNEFPKGVGGFKPYLSYTGVDPEERDAYKSIQDILDAHEANKGSKKGAENLKLEGGDKSKYSSRPKGKKAHSRRVQNELNKPCPSGRCRKRVKPPVRVHSRPYVRRIKHRVVIS